MISHTMDALLVSETFAALPRAVDCTMVASLNEVTSLPVVVLVVVVPPVTTCEPAALRSVPCRTVQVTLGVGLVSEVLPRDKLLPRAWELARLVLQQPELNRRYARICITEQLRRQFNDLLPYGLALEGLAITR